MISALEAIKNRSRISEKGFVNIHFSIDGAMVAQCGLELPPERAAALYDAIAPQLRDLHMDLDRLQAEAEKLLDLLKCREPGLFTWNDFLRARILKIVRLAKQAGIEA